MFTVSAPRARFARTWANVGLEELGPRCLPAGLSVSVAVALGHAFGEAVWVQMVFPGHATDHPDHPAHPAHPTHPAHANNGRADQAEVSALVQAKVPEAALEQIAILPKDTTDLSVAQADPALDEVAIQPSTAPPEATPIGDPAPAISDAPTASTPPTAAFAPATPALPASLATNTASEAPSSNTSPAGTIATTPGRVVVQVVADGNAASLFANLPAGVLATLARPAALPTVPVLPVPEPTPTNLPVLPTVVTPAPVLFAPPAFQTNAMSIGAGIQPEEPLVDVSAEQRGAVKPAAAPDVPMKPAVPGDMPEEAELADAVFADWFDVEAEDEGTEEEAPAYEYAIALAGLALGCPRQRKSKQDEADRDRPKGWAA